MSWLHAYRWQDEMDPQDMLARAHYRYINDITVHDPAPLGPAKTLAVKVRSIADWPTLLLDVLTSCVQQLHWCHHCLSHAILVCAVYVLMSGVWELHRMQPVAVTLNTSCCPISEFSSMAFAPFCT